MRTPILSILITILLIFVSNCVNSKESTMITARKVEFSIDNSSLISKTVDEKWEPAVFKEIKVGVNLRSDAIKILGKPDSSTDSDQNDLPIDNDNADANILDIYSNFAFYGELTVISSKKNGVVIQIESHPNNLPVEDAIKMWGNDYRKTKYDFAVCPNDAGSSAIYESKDGEITYIEYRSKGIAINTDKLGKQVDSIIFVSQPIGLPSSPHCSENANKHKGKV